MEIWFSVQQEFIICLNMAIIHLALRFKIEELYFMPKHCCVW
jgi:hypothetical protein